MPSRLTPNKAEQTWLLKVVELGCIVCRNEFGVFQFAEAHHIVGRSSKNGHWLILPLCDRHHRNGSDMPPYISRHPYKARFVAAYGNEMDLFEQVCKKLSVKPKDILKD